jgi:hypothetical protein
MSFIQLICSRYRLLSAWWPIQRLTRIAKGSVSPAIANSDDFVTVHADGGGIDDGFGSRAFSRFLSNYDITITHHPTDFSVPLE